MQHQSDLIHTNLPPGCLSSVAGRVYGETLQRRGR